MATANVSQDVLQNSWKVWGRAYAGENGAYRSRNLSQLVPFLVSTRNRNAMAGETVQVGRNILSQALNSSDKGLYSAVVKWRKYANIDVFSPDTNTGYCDLDGDGVEYNIKSYALNKRTVATAKFDGNINQCSEEDRVRGRNDVFQALLEKALTTFAIQVEKEVFAKTGATSYRHIGGLPTLDGTPRPAGEALPLFRASNASEMNFLGDRKLDRDRALGGLMDYVMFGDFMAKAYAKARDISRPTNDAGYDFSMLEELQTARYLFSDQMHTNTGLTHPLLLLAPGAIQLVTFAEFAQAPESAAGMTKTTVTDPLFGLQWNLIEYVKICEGRRFVTEYTLEIDWAIISQPTCEMGDARRDGTNGAYLYDIVCSDDTICDLTPIKALYEANAKAINACADVNATLCNSSCNVALSGGVSGNEYLVTASAVPSVGATIVTYAWLIDGVPVGANEPVLGIANDTVFGGEVINVTVTDSLGCVSTNSFVIDKSCPRPTYSIKIGNGSPAVVSNGQVVAGGAIADGTAIALIYANDAAAVEDFVLSALDITGDFASTTIPAMPETVAAGGDSNATATVGTVAGDYSVTFTVASNDCNEPAFTVTVEYSLT